MGPTVMIVDDSSTVRHELVLTLTQAGLTVIEAIDGEDGIDKLRRGPLPALVICDVNMPRMSGLAMLEAARRDMRIAVVPFLMLTSEGQPHLLRRARELGARAWIVKPVKHDLLLDAVRKITADAAAATESKRPRSA